MSGPVGISAMGYQLARRNVVEFIHFLAILSVNLAVLNFLPIPILDGGHMLFLLWEAVRGRPPSQRVVVAANYLGLMIIIALAILITGYDIFRLAR
jgi:regulator of sigma E protease